MPTRKIRDIERPCMHHDHNPPNMMHFEPGEYEHTCPSCGHMSYFTVPYIGGYFPTTPYILPRRPLTDKPKECWWGDPPSTGDDPTWISCIH